MNPRAWLSSSLAHHIEARGEILSEWEDADQHPEEPWRPAYDAFCAAMDWTGEEPGQGRLFGDIKK